jgi:dethiobiotin synthetase
VGKSLFITGTDTGVGKTTVASAIAAALRRRQRDVGVSKPVETGCQVGSDGRRIPADAEQLRWAAGREDEDIDLICPFRLRDPLAPSVAARREGMRLELSDVIAAVRSVVARHELALVDGAGGLHVPISAAATFADLARTCELRLLVVVGNRLGAINHARLTLDWARSAGLDVAGYVINTLTATDDLAADTNVATLRELLGAPLGVFPYLGAVTRTTSDRARLADAAERSLALDGLFGR